MGFWGARRGGARRAAEAGLLLWAVADHAASRLGVVRAVLTVPARARVLVVDEFGQHQGGGHALAEGSEGLVGQERVAARLDVRNVDEGAVTEVVVLDLALVVEVAADLRLAARIVGCVMWKGGRARARGT